MPVIEEHSGEGRDSSDGQLGNRLGRGPNGERPGDSRADILAGIGLENWSPVRTPLVGSAGETLLGNSPPTFGAGALIAAGAGGLGAAAVFGASPPRPGPGAAVQAAHRMAHARHLATTAGQRPASAVVVTASSGTRAVVTGWPSVMPEAAVSDLSPGQAARSHALILEHGSPPRAVPGCCPLASTLDPNTTAVMSAPSAGLSTVSTPAVLLLLPPGSVQSRASGLASANTSAGNTAHGGGCYSPPTPPAAKINVTKLHAPGELDFETFEPSGALNCTPADAGATGLVAAAGPAPARPVAASSARSLLGALLPAAAVAAPASVPLPAVPGQVEAPALLSAAAVPVAAGWFNFGWSRGSGIVAEPIKGGPPIAATADGDELPLQLPGLPARTNASGSPALTDAIAAATGGAGTVLGAAAGHPRSVAAVTMPSQGGCTPAQPVSRHNRAIAGSCLSGPSSASSSASGLVGAADCGSDGNGAAAVITSGMGDAGSGATGAAVAKLRAKGEVFRSCESLAAAVPGSMDMYMFSPGATPRGADGDTSWLDPNTPRGALLATSVGGRGGSAARAARSGGGASLTSMLRVALFGSATVGATPQSAPVTPVVAAISQAYGQETQSHATGGSKRGQRE